ncbi:unnamed protein product [Closterium sp. Naga37s-1]|nr:unnamed protein product [Closterium sp. Naga37s-1]
MQALREVVLWPIKYAKEAAALGLKWPSGVLLYGPPGTGKVRLSSSIFGAYAGESERRLRDVFDAARGEKEEEGVLGVGVREGVTEGGAEGGADVRPSIVFIDEIDVLCPKRDSRLAFCIIPNETPEPKSFLLLPTAMDSHSQPSSPSPPHPITPSPPLPFSPSPHHPIPPSSLLPLSNAQLHARSLPLHADVDMRQLAARCKGYVGADLAAVCREAALAAVMDLAAGEEERGGGMVEEGESGGKEAMGEKRTEKRLQMAVEWPLQHPEAFWRLALTPPRGVLLHGPPGGGKTMLALAAAHASKATLFSLRCASFHLSRPLTDPRSHPSQGRAAAVHGLPGGGKTMLVLAAAHADHALLSQRCRPLFHVRGRGGGDAQRHKLWLTSVHPSVPSCTHPLPICSGADLFSMYVGEGEAMLKDTFRLARMAAPSVVFVDEVDVVGGRRSEAESSGSGGGGGGGGGGSVGERLLAALLTEMDGLQSLTAPSAPSSTTSNTRQGSSDATSAPSSSAPSSSSSSSVLVIAATNRFQALDPAIIRPGRFDSVSAPTILSHWSLCHHVPQPLVPPLSSSTTCHHFPVPSILRVR